MAGRNELGGQWISGFIANLTPERSDVDDACVSFIDTLFATPARDAGRPIWGFKEVRYGLPDVLVLRELFPQLRVVQLVRDPRDVLRSLDEWERSPGWSRVDTEQSLRHLAQRGRQLRRLGHRPVSAQLHPSGPLRGSVHFSEWWTTAIAEHCSLEADLLDRSVFDQRVHTAGPRGRTDRQLRDWSGLPASLRALVEDEDVHMVASTYGYDLA